jgi:hypothetical protein
LLSVSLGFCHSEGKVINTGHDLCPCLHGSQGHGAVWPTSLRKTWSLPVSIYHHGLCISSPNIGCFLQAHGCHGISGQKGVGDTSTRISTNSSILVL